jgi:hypothetical protein
VSVAGRKQHVDVTATYRLFDGPDRDAAVLVDQKARDPADAESAGDQAACGERFAGGRDDVRLEADVAARLQEEAVG